MLPCQMAYSSDRQQDLTHSNLLIFLSYLSIKEAARSIYIFLKACWRSSPCWHIESNLFCGSMTKIFSTMTQICMVSLVCLFVFLTACWRSSSRSQIESYLFATAWERSSAKWQKFTWFSLVCLCVLLVLKLKIEEGVFIEVLGCCGPHKLLVQCGPYKRIICWTIPDLVIWNTLTPYVNLDFRIRNAHIFGYFID